MPLPATYKPKPGDRLIEDATSTTFAVLCNCSRSQPRHHTARFVQNNPSLYSLPRPAVPVTAGAAARGTELRPAGPALTTPPPTTSAPTPHPA